MGAFRLSVYSKYLLYYLLPSCLVDDDNWRLFMFLFTSFTQCWIWLPKLPKLRLEQWTNMATDVSVVFSLSVYCNALMIVMFCV
jgi:hypothetical protein